MHSEPGTLQLLTAPRWLDAGGGGHDVPDNLPGYLLVHLACRGEWVTREALAALFWPARAEPEALNNLRANLHRVRELLAAWGRDAALRSEPRRVRIELPTDVAALRAALARGDWDQAADAPGDALLTSLSFRGFAQVEDWAAGERRSLAAAWRGAVLKAVPALVQGGDARRAGDALLRLLHGEASNERALQELLRIAAAAGRQDEALAAYVRFGDWMRSDLGLPPDPTTVALADALRHSGGIPAAPPRSVKDGPPSLLLFGPPQLRAAAVPFAPERRYQLLVVLGLRAGEWVTREHLAMLLWPDLAPADARRNLRHTLFKAREIAGAENIEATDHALRWSIDTDLLRFRAAVGEQRHAEAIAWRRGALAAGIEDPDNRSFVDWIAAERVRLDAQWRQAALEHLRSLAAPAQRIAATRALLQADPLDEAAFSALLAAEMEIGNRAQAQRLYRDYAARLAEELGVEPPQQMRDLLAGATAAAAASTDPAGEFVGRRTELAELERLLGRPATRLITLLGPGGIGKSTLARRALPRAGTLFPGGAVWVELQDLGDAAAALGRLARQLGIEINEAQDRIEQLGRRLQGPRTLAVLDNAEHLDELPQALSRLLEAAPALTTMLTSRRRLQCPGEILLPLDGLAVPDADSRDPLAAPSFDAVRLFELRATAAQRGFRLERHLSAVIEIVETVGGLPLAIELAASWVRLVPPEEIARDLRGAIEVLERDPTAPGAPARPEHSNLRAVLDRSWNLLAPSERDAMAALSVFRGGFTHAAARSVAATALPVLSSLVDKSMLKVDPAGRFDMHPLVAADAAARVRADPARHAGIDDRHAEYFARHLESTLGENAGDARSIVDAVTADEANCLSAWRHAIVRGRQDLIAGMLPAWRTYYRASGRFRQSVRHFDDALAIDAPPHLKAELQATLAYFLYRDRHAERAIALATESLEVAESLGDQALAQSCVTTIGGCKLIRGEWVEARGWAERSLELARRRSIRQEVASESANLALITTFLGEFDRAAALYEEAIAIQSELDNSVSAARAMCNLGFVYVARGDWLRARRELDQALRYAIDRGVGSVAVEAEFLLGSVLVELGELEAAQRRLEHARDGFRANRNAGFELKTDYYLARIAARRGQREQGTRELLAAVRRARERGWTYDVLYASIFVAEVLAGGGWPAEAALILHSVRTAPRAHAFVGTLVDFGLRALPPEYAAGAAPCGAGFDTVADVLAGSGELQELVARLRPALA